MTRLSVNINDETAEAIRLLAQRQEVTITEIIRQAIGVYKYLVDQIDAGKEVQLQDDHSTTTLRMR